MLKNFCMYKFYKLLLLLCKKVGFINVMLKSSIVKGLVKK